MPRMPSTPGRGQPTRTVPAGYQLTALETVAGSPYGVDPVAPPLPAPSGASPRQALERTLLGALERSPCLVTFSGGRDSSTLLALTATLARDHGLPAPVPVTHRFPDAPESDEAHWQELVIDRLALDDWVRLEWHDEMDILGPIAGAVLSRHGQVMPFNAHFMAPMLERARGGSLVTGVGGDELFGPVDRPVLAALRYARQAPRPRGPAPARARAGSPEQAPRAGGGHPPLPRVRLDPAARARAAGPGLRARLRDAAALGPIDRPDVAQPLRTVLARDPGGARGRPRRRPDDPVPGSRRTGRHRRPRGSGRDWANGSRRCRPLPASCCPRSCSSARPRPRSTRRSTTATHARSPTRGTAPEWTRAWSTQPCSTPNG